MASFHRVAFRFHRESHAEIIGADDPIYPCPSNNSTATSPPVAGLARFRHCLTVLHPTLERLDAPPPFQCGVRNSDILRSHLGLPTQGKSDFDAIVNFCGDAFFKKARCIGLPRARPAPARSQLTTAVRSAQAWVATAPDGPAWLARPRCANAPGA